jgi:hypothetical protein
LKEFPIRQKGVYGDIACGGVWKKKYVTPTELYCVLLFNSTDIPPLTRLRNGNDKLQSSGMLVENK